ncbi:MAG: hypothetical protein WDO71_10255 [Bacteroidota bacterium]
MTGVSITILVKKPKAPGKAKTYYFNFGDYLNRKEKLGFLQKAKTVENIEFAE